MEEKIKISFDTNGKIGQYALRDKDGNEFIVSKSIPYADKEHMAFELAEQTTVIDEKQNVCYQGYTHHVILLYLIVKYYTNIDVSESTYEEVYNWLVVNEIDTSIYGVIENDIDRVLAMADSLFETAQITFDKSHSLSQKVLNVFGSMLEGEDMIETIAQMPEISNHLIEMMNAYNEQQKQKELNAKIEEPQVIAMRTPRKKGIKVGGAMLNMAKKS